MTFEEFIRNPLIWGALGFWLFATLWRNQLTRSYQELARKEGWNYWQKWKPSSPASEWPSPALAGITTPLVVARDIFHQTHSDHELFILQGVRRIRAGKTEHAPIIIIVLTPELAARTPDFNLVSATELDWLLEKFGILKEGAGIGLDGHPEFSKKYRLEGADAEAVKNYFKDIPPEILIQNQSWSITSQNGTITFRKDPRFQPKRMPKLWESARPIIETFLAQSRNAERST